MLEGKISGASAPPDFSFTVARVAVAQICQSVGYDGAQRPALETLTDIATRYLKAISKLSAESANSSGRTQSNLFDIIAAIEDLKSVEGFDGSWRVRSRSLWRSSAIKELMRLFKFMDKIPFARPLPPRRSCSDRGRPVLKAMDDSEWYNEGSLKHVPRWLPAVEGGGEAEEREGEVKWDCLKREEPNLGCKCSEMNKLKRECYDEVEELASVKRAKVRFKMGDLGKLRCVGIVKR